MLGVSDLGFRSRGLGFRAYGSGFGSSSVKFIWDFGVCLGF